MEIFDLFDKDRQLTGKTVQRGSKVPGGLYRMVIHIAIINSSGKMLIQQRADDKDGWPGLWDLSVGGHNLSGESSSQGAARELSEELGIEMELDAVRPAFTVNFLDGFDDYYVMAGDIELSDITLQAEEVQAVRWAEREEILSMIDSGEFIPYKKSLIYLIFEMSRAGGAHR